MLLLPQHNLPESPSVKQVSTPPVLCFVILFFILFFYLASHLSSHQTESITRLLSPQYLE